MAVDLVVDQELNPTAQTVKDQSGNSSPLSLTDAGNVGIGTTNPVTSLHVHETDSTKSATVMATVPAGGVAAGVTMVRYGDGFVGASDAGHDLAGNISFGAAALAGEIIVNPGTDRDVIFEAGPMATVAIKGDSGNVGIGTSTPSERLEVNGTVKAASLEIVGPIALPGDDFTLSNLPDVSAAPAAADIRTLVVDRATGKLYLSR